MRIIKIKIVQINEQNYYKMLNKNIVLSINNNIAWLLVLHGWKSQMEVFKLISTFLQVGKLVLSLNYARKVVCLVPWHDEQWRWNTAYFLNFHKSMAGIFQSKQCHSACTLVRLLVHFAVLMTSVIDFFHSLIRTLGKIWVVLILSQQIFLCVYENTRCCSYLCNRISPSLRCEWVSEVYSLCQTWGFNLLSLTITYSKGIFFIYTWTQNQIVADI